MIERNTSLDLDIIKYVSILAGTKTSPFCEGTGGNPPLQKGDSVEFVTNKYLPLTAKLSLRYNGPNLNEFLGRGVLQYAPPIRLVGLFVTLSVAKGLGGREILPLHFVQGQNDIAGYGLFFQSGRGAAWLSALAWGARGQRFKSARPDQFFYPVIAPIKVL